MTPAAQMTVRASTCSTRRRASWIATEPAATSTTVWPTSGVTPSRSSARAAFRESDSGKLVSTRSAASTSSTRAVARVDRAEVAAQRVVRELGDLAGHLDAGRPGADDDEREPAPPPLRVGLDLGRLERGEDAAADVERAVERLQLGRVRRASRRGRSTSSASRPRRRACRRGAPAARRRSAGRRATTLARASRSKPVDLGQQDAGVRLPLEHRAQRRRDLGRRRARRSRPGRRAAGRGGSSAGRRA